MESYCDVPLPGVLPPAYSPEKFATSTGSKFEELFPGDNVEEEDASQEWLSIFLEECLSNTTYCITIPPSHQLPHQQSSNSPSSTTRSPDTQNPKPTLHQDLVSPPKASRTKRRRVTPGTTHPRSHHTLHVTPSDPPLLPQDCWLADSELIILKKEQEDGPAKAAAVATSTTATPVEEWTRGGTEVGEKVAKDGGLTQPRRCSHCLSQKTPQWRAGPLGPKTLCNACGVRFKSGRLLPEYRPAKSPTFVSCKHSNSHKKVLEMRMSTLSSSSN